MRGLVWGFAVLGILALTMVDVVHSCGGHDSHLVIAPYPTWRFEHPGGTEFRPAPRPWWIRHGWYVTICEVTDS